jgi:hypothetical protein
MIQMFPKTTVAAGAIILLSVLCPPLRRRMNHLSVVMRNAVLFLTLELMWLLAVLVAGDVSVIDLVAVVPTFGLTAYSLLRLAFFSMIKHDPEITLKTEFFQMFFWIIVSFVLVQSTVTVA